VLEHDEVLDGRCDGSGFVLCRNFAVMKLCLLRTPVSSGNMDCVDGFQSLPCKF